MIVDIWSDVVCPWCYIGKRRFERALAAFPHGDEVRVRWRSFELDPTAPPIRQGDPVQRLSAKYGISPEQARAAHARLTALAADEGLEYRLATARSGNSFDAHRLVHLAAEHGLQDALEERLMAAYLCQEQAIGDRGVLLAAAVASGLPEDAVTAVLEDGTYADAVRADEAEAAARGVSGVPFFLIDGTFAIPGAQDPETILTILRRAWERRTGPTPDDPRPAPAPPPSGPPQAQAR